VSVEVRRVQLTRAGRRQGRRATAALLLLALAAAAAAGCPRQPARIPARRDPGWLALLVQGEGAAAAVAGVGGRVAAGLPLVGGLLAGVRADRVAELARRPGVRLVVDADRPLRLEGEPADQAAPAAAGGGAGLARAASARTPTKDGKRGTPASDSSW
jgi:hypothetical protein